MGEIKSANLTPRMENDPSTTTPSTMTEGHPTRAMSPQQLRSDIDTIRSVLNEGSAGKGPHRMIIAAGNIATGLMPLVAVPFILLGTSIPAFIVPLKEGGLVPLYAGVALTAVLVAIAIPFFLAGWGLAKNRRWGSVAAVVAAILNIWNIPLGTALTIYTFWALAKKKLSD
jgi:hypothetical protein